MYASLSRRIIEIQHDKEVINLLVTSKKMGSVEPSLRAKCRGVEMVVNAPSGVEWERNEGAEGSALVLASKCG